MRHRHRASRRRPLRAVAALAAAAVLALLLQPAAADDRDLLRFDSAKPYLFIVLDTSASMGMKMGLDEWAPGGADGPDSRLYQAKQALFNVLRNVEDVHFGFAGYNQDGVHATGKHWLYYSDTPLPATGQWPIQFPRPDLWDVDGDGSALTALKAIPRLDGQGDPIPIDPDDPGAPIRDTRVSEIGNVNLANGQVLNGADLMTFGEPFDGTIDGADRIVGGTCASPLDLTDPTERDAVESFAIRPSAQNPTWIWVESGRNNRYLLSVNRPGNRPDGSLNAILGQDRLHLILELRKVSSCTGSPFGQSVDHSFNLRLRLDPQLNQFFYVNQETWAAGEGDEATLPMWEHSDIVSQTRFDSHPHTGFGWEGNYDSDFISGDPDFDDEVVPLDFACEPGTGCDESVNVKHTVPTTVPPGNLGRAFDFGDVIPFDWDLTRRNELLTRLDPEFNPNLSSLGDFRVARHFKDEALPDGGLPVALDPDAPRPLLAADLSPLARALTDVRCWYLGSTGQGSNKCRETLFDEERFDKGWSQIACAKDSSFGCRRNFLIVITDGGDNVAGQDANGSIGNLKNSANMVTWALNVGKPDGCNNNSKGGLRSIVQAGGGECVNVDSQERLRQVLESLIGQIRTTARSFASAAVPSVQATVDQKIFLTSFLPFNDSAVWKGSLHSFLKPLPVSAAGVPLTEAKCDGSGDIAVDDSTQGCHLWDAGEILLTKQMPASGNDYLDLDDIALRRVIYAQDSPTPGTWASNMRLFDPLAIGNSTSPDARAVRFDLWRGMKIPFTDDDTSTSNTTAQNTANAVVDYVLRVKTGTELNTDVDPPVETPHDLVLGDVFHSTPVVIGTPANTLFFATDLYGNGAECDPDDGTEAANPGYRCFFQKQRFRRKMLLVGSNDGMLHAFDAGMFRRSGDDHWTGAPLVDENLSPFGSFDNGTGKELFGYVPRMVLPTLKSMQANDRKHQFTVDGTVTVADVFIDPLREASSQFPLEADHEWRTVVIGGLREGGGAVDDVNLLSQVETGYYALDITQPDPVEEDDELDLFFPTTATSGDNDPDTGDFVPVCTASLDNQTRPAGLISPPTEAGCGPVPFPAVLWEFTDSHWDPVSERTFYADEEVEVGEPVGGVTPVSFGNGLRDLGATWSPANIGRIRLCETGGTRCDPTPDPAEPTADDDLVDVFVAVVGGGMDPLNKNHDWRAGDAPADRSGNWLYMIDIETGEAIYKRELVGAVPSEPAAVDTNGDGYLDRIYIGTLAGALYRVDLAPIVAGGEDSLPAPVLTPVRHVHPASGDVLAPAPQKPRIPPSVWRPVKIFDTRFDGANPSPHLRPIYHRPSVIFQAGSGEYVLAFGTGDRDNLWSVPEPLPQERFYVFVDRFRTTAEAEANGALNESGLALIDPESTPETAANLLLPPSRGWAMLLASTERVITDAFALSGVMVFSTFVPRIEDGEGNELVVGCDGDESSELCSKQGVSNVFVVNATNANGFLVEGESTTPIRFKTAPTFVTNPFAEPGQTQQTGSENDEGEHTADDLLPNMLRVMETLKGLFPPQCKFANYRIDIKTVAADTSLHHIAAVPVCLIESNWKEF